MKLLRPAVLAALGWLFTTCALGAPIPVTFQGTIIEFEPGVDQPLPILLCQCLNNVRFRYFVPDYASLVNINSITFSVDIVDAIENGYARGSLVFVLNNVTPGANAEFATFGSSSGGFVSPQTVTGSVNALDLPNALLEIQGDGIFFIRVNRDGNNRDGNEFFVDNPIVTIDGDLADVPEPATLPCVAVALLVIGRLRRRWRRD